MKITKLLTFLSVTGLFVAPLFAFAAPALDSIPDAVKSKYRFVGGEVKALVTDGTTLYVGGNFTEVLAIDPPPGDPPIPLRANLAAIDLTTYEVVADFNPQPNYGINALALSGDGSTLYVGGDFSCFGAWDEDLQICSGDERFNLAAINTADGTVLSAFSPEPSSSVSALALSPDGLLLYAGGGFSVGGAEFLASFTTADNTATAFDANINDTVNSIVVSSDGAVVYATGIFETINGGIPQNRLAAFDGETGDSTSFSASLVGFNSFGNALALSSDDGTLYVGGLFDLFLVSSGEGMVFDETTQESVAVFPKISTIAGDQQTVYAAIPDGVGGWYVGGSFTNVGTTTQGSLAHITAAGAFDGAFNPDIDNNASVFALALSSDGSTLYTGGQFNSVENGTTRNYVAAFNTSDGSVTAFDPDAGGTVRALALSDEGTPLDTSDDILYMGGEFGTFDGGATFRNYVGAFTTVGAGTVTAFDPQMCGQVNTIELTGDGGTLYMGGDFTCVNSETTADVRNYIAAFDTAGAGTLIAGFNPNADWIVEDLLLAPGEATIYVGGSFGNIGGQARLNFAEIDTSTGLATALDAGIVSAGDTVYAIGVSSDENTLYIGGDSFSQVGGAARSTFAEIDVVTGLATDFNPGFDSTVRSISVAAGDVFIGGSFTGFGYSQVSNLIAVDTSDSSLVSVFAPDPDNTVRTLSLSSDDALLYVGGDFSEVNGGAMREYLAAFDTTDGDATAFDPTGEVLYGYASALKGDDSELYFSSYDADVTGNSELLIFDAAGVEADETPPVITLLGSTPVNLTVGDAYADAGATAEDDVDGDITDDIVTVNPVDTNTVGVYTVTYNVADAALNAATEVTRTVNVSAAEDGGDDGGGGGSSSRRRTTQVSNSMIEILTKLILTLRELIALMIAQQATQ